MANTDQFVAAVINEAGYKNTGEIALDHGRAFAKSPLMATFTGQQLAKI